MIPKELAAIGRKAGLVAAIGTVHFCKTYVLHPHVLHRVGRYERDMYLAVKAACHCHPPVSPVGVARGRDELSQIKGVAQQGVVLADDRAVAIVAARVYLRVKQVHRVSVFVVAPKVEEIVKAVAARLGEEDTGLDYWIEIGQIAIDIIHLTWIDRVSIQHQVFVSVRNPAPIGKGNEIAIFVGDGSEWEINDKVM